jgi:succinoglycan biosynthesis transport protein ExoP
METTPANNIFGKIRVQFRRYVGVVQRTWWLLPLTVSVGMVAAAIFILQSPPAFESVSRMAVPGQLSLDQGGAAYAEDRSDSFNGTQRALMRSEQVQTRAAARVVALHPNLASMHADFAVTLEPNTEIFDLSAVSPSSVYSQAFLDAVMDEYLNLKKEQRYATSDSTAGAITEEMKKLDKEMADNDAEMLAFQRVNDVSFLEKEGDNAGSYLLQLDQQLAALTTEYNLLGLQDVDQTLDRQQAEASAASGTPADMSKSDNALVTYGPIADYQTARQKIATLQAQLADMSTRLKPAHPKIIAINEDIKATEGLLETLRAQSVEALKTHREAVGVEIKNLTSAIAAQKQKALDLSVPLSEYNRLKTKSDRTKSEYDRLLANRGSLDITKNVAEDSLVISDPASPAISVKPGVLRIMLMGIIGGLLTGLLIIFFIDKMDDRISSLIELQSQFPEPLLGQIPKEALASEGALLKPGDERQAFIEAFRTLRSSLMFQPVEGKRPKMFVITSALPDEGKTTVSSNLAVTLAFSGAKTLIIDADMRSGKVSHLFGAQGAAGLSNVLTKGVPWREVVSQTWIDNLYLMPCGPSVVNTAEHLLGKVTDKFIQDIYDQFDYVLFDSPPVIILDDTLSLAPKIDATLFVLRFDQSSARASRRALELLHGRQANVIGLICNGVALSETEYNYNYSYRQYGTKYQEHQGGHDRRGAHSERNKGAAVGIVGQT